MKKFLTGKKPNLNQARASESGQLLVEAVVALGIIIASVAGTVSLISRAVHQSRLVADQLIAVNLAAEGIEVAKNILDSNAFVGGPWNDDYEAGNYCLAYNSSKLEGIGDCLVYFHPLTGFYDHNTTTDAKKTSFSRSVKIEHIAGQIQATSTVKWTTSYGEKSVALQGDFLSWR